MVPMSSLYAKFTGVLLLHYDRLEQNHFQTFTMPFLAAVITRHCDARATATSVMTSLWPCGAASGPRRGVSSVVPVPFLE